MRKVTHFINMNGKRSNSSLHIHSVWNPDRATYFYHRTSEVWVGGATIWQCNGDVATMWWYDGDDSTKMIRCRYDLQLHRYRFIVHVPYRPIDFFCTCAVWRKSRQNYFVIFSSSVISIINQASCMLLFINNCIH